MRRGRRGIVRHLVLHAVMRRRRSHRSIVARARHAGQSEQCERKGNQQAKHHLAYRTSIQTAIAIIIRFSVSETNPSGTLLLPPTQAHFKARLST